MGRTRTPLKILIVGPVHPEVLALRDAGHQVDVTPFTEGLLQYNLILGPNCMCYLAGMKPFLSSFIKRATKARQAYSRDAGEEGNK